MHAERQRLAMLRLLQQDPRSSQRELAQAMGISLGKVNYCLKALVEKGFIKLGNFRRSDNKRAYAYVLTPAGLEEKTRIVVAFLKRKEVEFDAIQQEINELRRELPSKVPGAASES